MFPVLQGILEFAKEYGLTACLLVLGAVALAYLTVPQFHAHVAKRLERRNARHAARLALSKDYYNRRLETYLRLWKETQDAVRSILSAGHISRPGTWEDAKKETEELTDFFWNNRPLLSKNVFDAVKEVAGIQATFATARLGGSVAHAQWTSLNARIKSVQHRLLLAIEGDLSGYGLQTLLADRAETEAPPIEPEKSLDPEDEMLRLAEFVAKGEARMEYVGVSWLNRTYAASGGGDAARLVNLALEKRLLRGVEVTADDGATITAVEADLSALSELAREDTDAVLAKRRSRLPSLEGFIEAVEEMNARMPYVGMGALIKRWPQKGDAINILLGKAVAAGSIEYYEFDRGDDTVSAIRPVVGGEK